MAAIDAKTLVNIYKRTREGDSYAGIAQLADCFPEAGELAEAVSDLTTDAVHFGGGGAAPVYFLTVHE